MNFLETVKVMKEGKKTEFEDWAKGTYAYIKNNMLWLYDSVEKQHRKMMCYTKWINGNWEIVEEKEDIKVKCIFCKNPIHIDNFAGIKKEGMFSSSFSFISFDKAIKQKVLLQKTLSDDIFNVELPNQDGFVDVISADKVQEKLGDIKEDVKKAFADGCRQQKGEQVGELDIHALDDKEVIGIINKKAGKRLI